MNLKEYILANKPKGFVSRPHYFREGDFVSLFLHDEPYIAERIDEVLTIYRARGDRSKMVGIKVKGVRRLLKDLGDFHVRVHDGRVDIGLFLLAGARHSKNPSIADAAQVQDRYLEAAKLGRGVSVDVEELQPA